MLLNLTDIVNAWSFQVRSMEVEFVTIVEFIVLGAVAIELFALYNHSKLVHRIVEHILDTDRNLEKYDVTIQLLSNNMSKLDERMNKLDEHMARYDGHMNKLDEHINKLDDFLWKSYLQKPENINDPRIQK